MTHLFIDLSEAFHSILKGKMERIHPAVGLPKERVKATMMLDNNAKVKVASMDGDTHFFDIVVVVLQRAYISLISA